MISKIDKDRLEIKINGNTYKIKIEGENILIVKSSIKGDDFITIKPFTSNKISIK